MKLLIDADACPGEIKDVIFRASERTRVPTILVANRPIKYPRSPFISQVVVSAGMDVADGYIAKVAEAGDLAVTADIPLAALLVPQGVVVIDPRGGLYSPENIGEKLAMRNFMQEMRSAGLAQGGPRPLGGRDKQLFAATFDRELNRLLTLEREQKR
jgi:uncharacterized protein YaiI (UPF0178 family)